MTFAAGYVPVCPGSNGEAMVKYGLVPGDMGGKVTGFATGRETGGLVIGIGGVFVIGPMAPIAIRRQVVAVGVASIAVEVRMRALQRPILVMIKDSPLPGQGIAAMTGNTVGGEPGLLVIGILGGVVLLQVTTRAVPWSSGVDIIFMAIGTGGGLMLAFQGEGRMIHNRPCPGDGPVPMTALAIGGIPGLLVVGILSGVIIGQVAAHAVSRRTGIDVVFMTIAAGGGLMSAS